MPPGVVTIGVVDGAGASMTTGSDIIAGGSDHMMGMSGIVTKRFGSGIVTTSDGSVIMTPIVGSEMMMVESAGVTIIELSTVGAWPSSAKISSSVSAFELPTRTGVPSAAVAHAR